MDKSKFNRVWQEDIRPALANTNAEIERKKARRQRIAGIVALGSVGGIFFVTLISGDISFSGVETWTIVMWMIGLLVTIVAAVFYSFNDNNFSARFKRATINGLSGNLTEITWGINEDTGKDELSDRVGVSSRKNQTYSPPIIAGGDGVLTGVMLKDSGLYDDFDYCLDGDLIFSKDDEVRVFAHRMSASRTTGGESINVFSGFLIRIDTSKLFRGETYVQTEADGEFMGKNIRSVGADSKAEETELEWGEFERFLLVKSTDPQEAREIFTPDFMQILYDWWQEHKEPMRISFKGSAVYMSYPTSNKLNPHVFGELNKEKEAVKSILELLLFIEDCVKVIADN